MTWSVPTPPRSSSCCQGRSPPASRGRSSQPSLRRPGAGTPAGIVEFEVDGQSVGSSELDSTGTARVSFDIVPTGIHTITAVYGGQESLFQSVTSSTTVLVDPPLTLTSIAPVSPDPINVPVLTIDVTFSMPIDTSTLNPSDLSLTDDGGPNLITGSVTIFPVSGTTYRIGGLGALTAADGTYTLSLDAAGVQDTHGVLGTGSLVTSWLMDSTPPTSTVTALPGPDRVYQLHRLGHRQRPERIRWCHALGNRLIRPLRVGGWGPLQ